MTIGKGTVAPNGTLDVYTSFVFTGNLLNTTGHINTVLLLDTTIASAPAPGTAFLRFHALPISGTLAATRVNLMNVEIGENRSMELVKQSGLAQFQDVYIASANPRTYQKFSISNPHLVTIGAYNLTGQTFPLPTQLTLKQSTITNGKLLGVVSGSSLKLDASTIDTELVRLDGTLAGNGTVRGAAGAGSNTTFLATSGSVLSPGLSIGTLNIQGNMNLVGPTSLHSELNPNAAQKADLLSVSGAFSGARNLTVTVEKDSSYSATGAGEIADFTGSNYTVVTAASIDSDAISLVEGGSLNAHLSARLVGRPSATGQVVVGFTDNSALPGHVPSKLPASTPWSTLASAIAATHHNTVVNGSAGGGTAPGGTGNSAGGQQVLSGGQTVSAAWLGLTNAQVGQLDQVHAEPFSSNLTIGLEQLEHIASSVMTRMSGHHDRHSTGTALWTDVSYIRGKVEGRNGLGSFGYSLSNLLVGADVIELERFNGGVFAGYGVKQMHEHDKVAQDFNGQKAVGGAYATVEMERFTLATVAGYAHGWHKSSRSNPNVGAFMGGVARSSYSSRSAFASAQLGLPIRVDETTALEPFVAA
ncbi:MAG: autotransporter domain-containing protein, partial [Hoeflea sp.]|nr:autotransporter domain-containing protein [Hoeflea sp.]